MMNARLAGRLERYHQAKVDAAKRAGVMKREEMQSTMIDTKDHTHTATPLHYWAVHVCDGSGATVWSGLYQAATMLDAFRWARRCWPQHAIHTTVGKKTPRQWLALLAPESRQREERRWRAAGVLPQQAPGEGGQP